MPALKEQVWYPLQPTCKRLPRAGAVYVLRCRRNNKIYVGKSINVQHRAYKHCRPEHKNMAIARAVAAHGVDAFDIMIWCFGDDEPALLALEVELIARFGCRAPAGYNLTAGGEGSSGYRHPPEVLARIAAANTGKKRPLAAVEATAAANRGLVRSAESNERNRQAQTGKIVSDAFRAKMSAVHRGRVLSAAHQDKITASLKNNAAVKENVRAIGLRRQRPVLMWSPGSMVPTEFASVKLAAEHYGKTKSEISNYCRGAQPRSGHQFTYLE